MIIPNNKPIKIKGISNALTDKWSRLFIFSRCKNITTMTLKVIVDIRIGTYFFINRSNFLNVEVKSTYYYLYEESV